jgi:hypothetical protein
VQSADHWEPAEYACADYSSTLVPTMINTTILLTHVSVLPIVTVDILTLMPCKAGVASEMVAAWRR